jgi:three-Cys-motif partner protein
VDDGLLRNENLGAWAEDKYMILFNYLSIFSSGMKRIWDKRVFIDLFSGSGCGRIRNSDKILKGSPLLALSTPNRFDKYIFCDKEPDNIDALRQRVEAEFPDVDVTYIVGDCNEKIPEIERAIPAHSKSNTVLTFCFVDPFDLGIHFLSLKNLAKNRLIDFLILLALHMDGNRNVKHYMNPRNVKVDHFLGDHAWRERWTEFQKSGHGFPLFLANEFEKRMFSLNYIKSSMGNRRAFKSDEKNLPLYHLAFFSKNPKGYKFWHQGLKYGSSQTIIEFEE